MATKRFYRRRFLNRRGHHAGAYALAECQLDAFRPISGPDQHSVDAGLTIADCARIVMLDFSVDSERDARNALHKARLLRELVEDFTIALEAAVEDWRQLQD